MFYFENSSDKFDYIEVNDKKISTVEKLEKTNRYNLINIDLKNAIKLFNYYSNDKILEENTKVAFKSQNLFYNFFYGKNKKFGKIYEIEKETELEEITKEEKILLKNLIEIIDDNKDNSFGLKNDFKNLFINNIYEIHSDRGEKIIKNHLNDLNNKFTKFPFYLKFYEKEKETEL